MRSPRPARPRYLLAALLLAAAAAIFLQGASVPHTHAGSVPGVYNQDHDLTLLATLHGAAALSTVEVSPVVLVTITAVALPVIAPADSAPRRAADSRAPPRA